MGFVIWVAKFRIALKDAGQNRSQISKNIVKVIKAVSTERELVEKTTRAFSHLNNILTKVREQWRRER